MEKESEEEAGEEAPETTENETTEEEETVEKPAPKPKKKKSSPWSKITKTLGKVAVKGLEIAGTVAVKALDQKMK